MLTTINPPVVRLASREEEPELMELCREVHKENGLFSMDEDSVKAMLQKTFNKEGGIIGVIGRPGHLEAMICIVMATSWSSKDTHLEELFSYVRPEFRSRRINKHRVIGKPHAESLVLFAKDCSDKIGVPLVIGIVTNKRMAAKVRLYRRILGYPAGAYFVINPKWANEEGAEDFWAAPFPDDTEKLKRRLNRDAKARHMGYMADLAGGSEGR